MSLSVEIEGLDETEALLIEWERLLRSDELWESATRVAAEICRRYAASISPEVTGAYRDSHTIQRRRRAAVMIINPTAINPVSGRLVTQYAEAVEARHQIYQRTFERVGSRAAVVGATVILERLR